MTLVSENEEEIEWTEEQHDLLDFLYNNEDQSCFITGNGGVGKSTVLNAFLTAERDKQSKHKHADISGERVVVLAPTGIAALNIGGGTIHSFFTLPPELLSVYDAQNYISRFTEEKLSFLRTLVIDEISMVRADIFAVMDRMLQLVKGNNRPFGGIRVILVGDIMQLPPVVRSKEESNALADLGSPNGWFFKTKSFEELNPRVFQLTQSFRQKDPAFYALLNRVRAGDRKAPFDLNASVRKSHEAPRGTLQLSCINANVDNMNEAELRKLTGEKATYEGTLIDKFPEKNCPVPRMLNLGVGARVMTVKNSAGYVNGSLGTILELRDTEVVVKLDRGNTVVVQEAVWESVKYQSNGNGISKVVDGTYKQLPVKLAWAMTIHKSQGQSLDSAVIDFGHRTFAHGQAYVALSRLRSLEGMYFSRPMKPNDIIIDPEVLEFLESKKGPKKTMLEKPKSKRPSIARAEE